jgi:hypothetical protein
MQPRGAEDAAFIGHPPDEGNAAREKSEQTTQKMIGTC